MDNCAVTFRKSTLLVFVILCSAVTFCQAKDESLTIECLKKYLKDRNINEDLLSFVNPYIGSLTDCESAVKTKLSGLFSDVRNQLSGDRSRRPFVECTMRDIEEEDDESYEKNILRETAVDMISSWRFWSYFSKNSRLDDLKAESKRIIDRSLLKCKGNRDFSELFTNIQEKSISWDRTGEEEYCVRKYLVEKKLINPKSYNFRDNPKNVRTEIQKCGETTDIMMQEIYDEIEETKKLSRCFMKVYRENHYADYILKAEVLSKLDLEKWDKSREKQDFINALVDITYGTQKC